jgi:hypothetical protein
MQLTMLNTPGSIAGLYPDFVGKRSIFVGTGTGPASYNATTGDPVTLSVNPFYIDVLFGGVMDTSGVYIAIAKPAASGVRQSWALFYIVASTGLPYAGGAGVSGKIFQIGGIGGQF